MGRAQLSYVLVAYVLVACLAGCHAGPEPRLDDHETSARSAAVFEQLQSLAGTWEGLRADGRKNIVTYRLTAGGTALAETWTLPSGNESVTIYHMDGASLLATHYCPQGNQPRLKLVPAKDARVLQFEFQDGTNLGDATKSHQRSFWLELLDQQTLRRAETYVPNGATEREAQLEPPDEPVTYRRIEPPEQSR